MDNDHDFWLNGQKEDILIQAVEIVLRDYLRELDFDDYLNGRHAFTNLHFKSQTEMLGVDLDAKKDILLNRIKAKLKKNHARQEAPLWLLIWTVCSDFFPFVSQGGTPKVSAGVTSVRQYLSFNGAGPFDEIWFINLELPPKRIWPE